MKMKVNMREPNDLLLDDLELLLREIDEFNTAITNNKPTSISQSLENYLQFVARSGNTVFPWTHVRNLIRTKMVNAIQQFQEPTCPNESFVLERFDLFRQAAPFTVQRLTELILQPTRHYRKKEKFLRGLEKTVLVVSTIEPQSLTNNEEERNGNDNNTSSSSCEAETETVAYNRTITLDPQDILTTSIRSSSIEVLSTTTTDNIVLDPVTTAVGTTVGIINQNITVTSGSLISDGVTSSAISAVEIITPDPPITVTSDGVIIEAVSDAEATSVCHMDSSEAQDVISIESSSIEPMDQSTSESEVIDSVSSVVATAVDVINQSSNLVVSSGLVPESVSTSMAPSIEVIIPDKTTVISPDSVILEPQAADMPSESAQDILTSPIPTSSLGVTDNIALEPVSTSVVGTTVDAITQNISIPSDSITASAVISAVEVITPEQLIAVSTDAVILDAVLDTDAAGACSMDSSEAHVILSAQSSSVEDQGSSENMVIDPVSSLVATAVDIINQGIEVASSETISENVTPPEIPSVDVVIPDQPAAAPCEDACDSKTIDVTALTSGQGQEDNSLTSAIPSSSGDAKLDE